MSKIELPDPRRFDKNKINKESCSLITGSGAELNELPAVFTRAPDAETKYSTQAKDLFLVKKKTFSQQFSNLYFLRLKQLKPKLQQRATKLHQDATLASRVLELKYDEHNTTKKYIVVGTVFKDMKLKPNILQEYTLERSDIKDFSESETSNGSRVSADDSIVLEDVSGRVTLVFQENKKGQTHKEQVDQLVTGIIVAVYGSVNELGHFMVDDTIFSELATQNPLSDSHEDQYVAFVSGLCVGHPQFSLQNTQNLVDYLTGALCGETEQKEIISKISRVVITGDSVWQDVSSKKLFDVRGSLRPVERASLVEPSKAVDRLIEQLAYSVHVDVMPGEFDPSNTSLPQQPLHPSMLPKSSQLTTCHLVTNPYTFQLSGVE